MSTWLNSTAIWLNGVDFTGYTNQAMLMLTRPDLDVTTFGSGGSRERIAGPRDTEWRIGGPWGFEDPDDTAWDAVNTNPTTPLLTIIPEGPTATEVAYTLQPRALSRTVAGNYGEVATYELSGRTASRQGASTSGSQAVSRGELTLTKQTVTGDTNGTVINPTLAATDWVVFGLHVFADNATSMSVQCQRDDSVGFATPTTLTTFAVTDVGSFFYRVPVALLSGEAFFRMRCTSLVGTNFQVAGTVAVEPSL